MNKLFLVTALALMLSGCGLTASLPLSDRISRLEATYTGALEIIVENRNICVADPNDDKCIVNDEVTRKINPIKVKIAEGIDEAKTRIVAGDEETARTLYEEAVNQFSDITKYVEKIKELVGA